LLAVSCGDDKPLIPKPPTYLRNDFPKHTYTKLDLGCPYSFEISNAYSYSRPRSGDANQSCHLDIDLGKLNGVMHFSCIDMVNPLRDYIEYSLKKVEEHEVKADAIDDQQFLFPDKKVYGTFFEIKGNVASPFQFYLTDSTDHFVSGVVYFNARPNYDSLKPSLDYLKEDILHLIKTFEWEK
jgi:gliding motility-associated lipoprotein GldD